ncbi:hypothetical protein Acid345_3411 [Candidatus Koribacter versatilis Ellin345]|uniref:Uncharacterized protein n=1 Tax=Koribacter versatilis (strain Ellin345) TaxID=204669 RepID=Q1IL38_KORVE|nr:hypothetical protein [Candidatus Koribacter versatilis]ABF42412.1 hypothetical protein Acid345_3411 [Candidatus Koribacter versatilis Ellin345]
MKAYITAFLTANGNYDPDGVAWFHATHGNLGSAALSSASLDAAELALMTQTEKDSNNPLGFPLEWLMVPPALKATAMQINRNDTGTNNWYQRFGANNERIFVNELLTDTNDWYAGCFPSYAPVLEVGFLDGIETPQIFLANQPTVGVTFSNDQIQYKVKSVFGGKPVDFRPIFKAVVA